MYPGLIISCIRSLASWSLNWHTVTGKGWLLTRSSSLQRSYVPSPTHLSPRYVNTTKHFLHVAIPEQGSHWEGHKPGYFLCTSSNLWWHGNNTKSRFIWSVSCHPWTHLLTQPTIKSTEQWNSTLRATLSTSSFKTNSCGGSRGAWWKRVLR